MATDFFFLFPFYYTQVSFVKTIHEQCHAKRLNFGTIIFMVNFALSILLTYKSLFLLSWLNVC